jgi:hypothetical protein
MAAGSTLKKITTRAKQIYKKGGTWKTAIKKAGAEYRTGKLGSIKSKKRKSALKRVKKFHRAEGKAMKALGRRPRRRRIGSAYGSGEMNSTMSAAGSGGIMGMSAASHISYAKEKLHAKISALYGRIFSAKTKLAKRKLNKALSELKSKYRKLC